MAATQSFQACRHGEDDLLSSKAASESERDGTEVTLIVANGAVGVRRAGRSVSQTAAAAAAADLLGSSQHHKHLWGLLPKRENIQRAAVLWRKSAWLISEVRGQKAKTGWRP